MPDQPASSKQPEDIIYACSGCSDAGELADRIARRLRDRGIANMGCLAGVGGRVKPMLEKARQARRIVVVDGCPLECAGHTLRGAGFAEIIPIKLHALGFQKGNCPVTEESIEQGATAVVRALKEKQG